MASRRDAKGVIDKIRKSRRANDPGGAAADANARSLRTDLKLDRLSTQLYTKSTHFMLELIQNADDNTYAPGVDPILTLAYREDGYLWVGCNEIGFSKANVEAICDINDSTKKVTNATKGYIGEKGIGFKSVFKVANVVWVSSGHYTFRFERDSVLGMIVPIWCDFNATPTVSERTMFCLQIPDVQDRKTVKADLLSLQTELLLFLRKLRNINVCIYDVGSVEPTSGFTLKRRQLPEPQPQTIVTLHRADLVHPSTEDIEELMITRLIVEGMPHESKREGIAATEVVLALPISADAASLPPRPIYNFLPIAILGFTFLLQADFILTANRENIASDNAWNNALLDGAVDLFITAVRQCNRTGICKYSWPAFATCREAAHGTVMDGFMTRLRKALQDESVLESQAGYLSRPSELMLVPEHFTNGASSLRPLFDADVNVFKYASFDYKPRELEMLGVPKQTPQQICALLRWMTPAQLEAKTAAWHSKLAAGIAMSEPSAFATARIIPLRSGEWVSANDGSVFLPSEEDGLDIPDGIEIRLVSRTACADPARRRMFTILGAKPLNQSQICQQILERHRFLSISNNSLSPHDIVAHAWYLFSYGSLGLEYGALKMVNELRQAVRGEDLYIQHSDSPFRLKDYLPGSSFAADFAHPLYLEQGNPSTRPRWYAWLNTTLHVSLLPNLTGSRKGAITREFRYLVDNHHSQVWLTLVRDNWQHYSMDRGLLSHSVTTLSVQCMGDKSCPLDEAYLGTTDMMREPHAQKYISLIDVPDPDNLGWLNLSKLGLRTAPDFEFWLSILRGMAKMQPSDISKDDVIRCYKAIGKHAQRDSGEVRNAFEAEPLVLPSVLKPSSTWRALNECRWAGPSCLDTIELLGDSSSECTVLFTDILGVKDIGIVDVIDGVIALSGTHTGHANQPVAAMKTLLLTLCAFPLDEPTLDNHLEGLAQVPAVPVQRHGMHKLSTFIDVDWFIADRARIARCFEDRLWLLDFERKDITAFQRLLLRMNVSDRRLSHHVSEDTIADGKLAVKPDPTMELRTKARYIALLGSTTAERALILSRMKAIQVSTCTRLLVRRHVMVDGQQILGRDEAGRAVLQRKGNSARLLFTADLISRKPLPWHLVCDTLMAFLGIPEVMHTILNSILHTDDVDMIEDILERASLLDEEQATAFANGDSSNGVLRGPKFLDAQEAVQEASNENKIRAFRRMRHSTT
nr:hypothetical protein B0A51_12253 [Rachicladosporium sp. CCFEE 5018]